MGIICLRNVGLGNDYKNKKPHLYEKWGLDSQFIATSVKGYFLDFFSYFLSKSWMASRKRSVRVLSSSTARNLIFLIMAGSIRKVTCFFSIQL